MYLTSIKKGTTPIENTGTSNIIDELFGIPHEENIIPSKFYRTRTAVVNNYGLSNSYYDNINKIKNSILNFISEHDLNEMYEHFTIPKRTGGVRHIDAPNETLKEYMKDISAAILRTFKLLSHDSAFAYVKGRSVIDAVKEHQTNNSNWFLKIDLKDFFGSCSRDFIVKQLSQVYPFAEGLQEGPIYREATEGFINDLATLACLDNKLPQGTPISPWLTNLIMIEFDYKINKMLTKIHEKGLIKQRYVYTRYADDILISAKQKFDYDKIIEEIKKIFKDTPLTIKDEKTRFGSSSGRNWNLGIMYNKDNELTVGHKKKRQIKDNIYYFIKFKDNFDLSECQWLLGNISWLRAVEPEYTDGLLKYYTDKFDINVWQTLLDKIKSFSD